MINRLHGLRWVALCAALTLAAGVARAETQEAPAAATTTASQPQPEMTLDTFLDRLMQSESGGRANARNPLSTAVGPYQFIASTWLQIARDSFATETAELKPNQVLDLRTDFDFARRAAKIYTEANAAHLVANGQQATFANLRLAHLVGAGGAVRVLSAKADTPVVTLLGVTVIGANPFMRSMTAEDLIARAARDIAVDARLDTVVGLDAGLTPSAEAVATAKKKPRKKAEPVIDVECDLARPSCRRWLALAKRNASRSRRASRE
jgi:Transglycosylase-like domain